MKRSLAYITAAWRGDPAVDMEQAAHYCRAVYDAGYSPIKKRKKAEIEAKKAAIRAEDIAKGVFVPVSSLPQREPMKGVQTA